MNERQIAQKLGVWNRRMLRVLERISAFREAHDLLDATIHEVYPQGCKVRVDLGGKKMVGTVTRYMLPLDSGLVIAVSQEDFDRCPEYAKGQGLSSLEIIRPWGCIEGPLYDGKE